MLNPLRIALVAGEHSGDRSAPSSCGRCARRGRPLAFFGVGGEAMEAEGLASLFPIGDIAVMGVLPVLARLPQLVARIRQTADAVIAARPDALVIIDSPDFTHRVARRVRAKTRRPADRRLREPERLGVAAGQGQGDARLYRLRAGAAAFRARRLCSAPWAAVRLCRPSPDRAPAELRPSAEEARRRDAEPPLVVVLPGSRRSEIRRLMDDFGGALQHLRESTGPFALVLPTLPHIEREVRALAALWPQPPRIVIGEAARFEAFRTARAALAASGTVTLELALAGVPTVGAYKVSLLEEQLKYLIKVPSILLPNLILGERAIPEKLQRECTPAALAAALGDLIRDGPARTGQLEALARLDRLMRLPDGGAPSAHAARAVLQTISARAAAGGGV